MLRRSLSRDNAAHEYQASYSITV